MVGFFKIEYVVISALRVGPDHWAGLFLLSVRPAAGLAFWGDDLWNPDDHVARRDLKRFGVELVTVWDPSAVLAPKPGAFGDVAFARYPSLAIYVVAARQMGVAHRWQRLNTPAP